MKLGRTYSMLIGLYVTYGCILLGSVMFKASVVFELMFIFPLFLGVGFCYKQPVSFTGLRLAIRNWPTSGILTSHNIKLLYLSSK